MNRRMILIFLLALVVVDLRGQSLSGSYTVGPGGTYATLSAAFADLTSYGASGSVTFLITGNITEIGSPSLTTTTLNPSRTLTVKPNAGVSATVTLPPTGSISISGTAQVTIDGSNSGSSSRDLTIKHSGTSANNTVISIGTGCTSIAIKNCILSSPTNTSDWTVTCFRSSNLTVQNNEIHGIGAAGNGILTLYRVKGSANVIAGNTISGDQMASTTGVGILLADTMGTVLITKNRLHTLRNSDNSWIIGIFMDNAYTGSFKIFSNFLGGSFVAPSSPLYYYLIAQTGMANRTVNPTSDVAHNTLVLNSIGGATEEAAGFMINKGTATFRNNIIINSYDVSASYCIANNLAAPTGLSSNYNDLVASGSSNKIGGNTAVGEFPTLAAWQAWSGVNPDTHSVSRSVTFTNAANDFHLTGSSVGDSQLRGTAALLGTVPDDIDGDVRLGNPDGPYMGADEAAMPLPVQMSTFTATILNQRDVRLDWATVSEIDNYGFYVQRRREASQVFSDLPHSFVQGHGTTNIEQHYSYTDSTAADGVWHYRLKQVDLDGTTHYPRAVRIELNKQPPADQQPTEFSLAQNYPNPFNPSTTIRYELPKSSAVKLSVYDMLGRQVSVLVNESRDAGVHEIKFDASGLSSGVYMYRLTAEGFVQTRRLLLLK